MQLDLAAGRNGQAGSLGLRGRKVTPAGGEVPRDLLDGFPPDLGHDGALSPEVLVAQAEEVVDDKRCGETREKKKKKKVVNSMQTFLLLIIITEDD